MALLGIFLEWAEFIVGLGVTVWILKIIWSVIQSPQEKKTEVSIELAYHTSHSQLEKAKSILEDIVNTTPGIMQGTQAGMKSLVGFSEFATQSLKLKIIYFLQDVSNALSVHDQVNMRIKKEFEQNGLEFARFDAKKVTAAKNPSGTTIIASTPAAHAESQKKTETITEKKTGMKNEAVVIAAATPIVTKAKSPPKKKAKSFARPKRFAFKVNQVNAAVKAPVPTTKPEAISTPIVAPAPIVAAPAPKPPLATVAKPVAKKSPPKKEIIAKKEIPVKKAVVEKKEIIAKKELPVPAKKEEPTSIAQAVAQLPKKVPTAKPAAKQVTQKSAASKPAAKQVETKTQTTMTPVTESKPVKSARVRNPGFI